MVENMSNNVIFITGHKNPDTDSICSAIGYAALKGEGYAAGRAGDVNPETQFVLDHFGLKAPELLQNVAGSEIILVDHNEAGQAVDGLADARIVEILDHHKIGGLQTSEPILFCNIPVGCTATIVTMFYQQSGKKPEPAVAGALCSAILSDTLAFRSPTCTEMDKAAARELAAIAGMEDVEAYAKEMFVAGSNLGSKTEKEILYLDFKKFTSGNTTFGVGQVTSMSGGELQQLKPRMQAYMQESMAEHGVDMLFLMLTDIMDESTDLIYCGPGAEQAVKAAFTSDAADRTYLKGVMSRKKQIVPQLTEALK